MHHFSKSIFIFLILISNAALSQEKTNTEKPYSIPFFHGFYGYEWPGADMAKRFGGNSALGAGFTVKTASNWLFGLEYDFLFGNNIDSGFSMLEHLRTSLGNIINGDGVPAVVALYERGFSLGGSFGKLFPVLSPNRNSGFFITAGLGYLQHKIRIEVENESAPQLKGDYKRGYDRLSGGFALRQSIGYLYFGERRLVNFYISLEITEAWTRSYREYYFDTMSPSEGQRFDILFGPKIGWVVPLRKRMSKDYYYY